MDVHALLHSNIQSTWAWKYYKRWNSPMNIWSETHNRHNSMKPRYNNIHTRYSSIILKQQPHFVIHVYVHACVCVRVRLFISALYVFMFIHYCTYVCASRFVYKHNHIRIPSTVDLAIVWRRHMLQRSVATACACSLQNVHVMRTCMYWAAAASTHVIVHDLHDVIHVASGMRPCCIWWYWCLFPPNCVVFFLYFHMCAYHIHVIGFSWFL